MKKVIERTWTVTLADGSTQSFRECSNTGEIAGYSHDVFFAGLEKMKAAGAKIVESQIELCIN